MNLIDNNYISIQTIIPDIKIISESAYFIIGFSEKKSLFYHFWKDEVEEMDEDSFKVEIADVLDILEKVRPTYLLVNDKKRKHFISQDVNDFIVAGFVPIYTNQGLKKIAIVSNEMFTRQIQSEKIVQELENSSGSRGATFMFFIDISLAIEWLQLEEQ